MQTQEYRKFECVDGKCPTGLEVFKEICLTSLEKRAVFFSLMAQIERFKLELVPINDEEVTE